MFDGEVRYARDAFEGLSLMDAVMAVKRGEPGCTSAGAARAAGEGERRQSAHRRGRGAGPFGRGRRRTDPVPAVPRRPDRQGHSAGGLRGLPRRAGAVPRAVGTQDRGEGSAQLRRDRGRRRHPTVARLAGSGCRPSRCWRRPSSTATGRPGRTATTSSSAIRSRPTAHWAGSSSRDSSAGAFLCLADFVRPGNPDGSARMRSTTSPSHIVTMGNAIARAANELFAADAYRDYMELHGLSVQLTEALAEYWHSRSVASGESTTATHPRWHASSSRNTWGALLLRLSGVSRPVPAAASLRTAASGAGRRGAQRGVPAAPGAVDLGGDLPPPGGHVFQCWLRLCQTARHALRRHWCQRLRRHGPDPTAAIRGPRGGGGRPQPGQS